MKISKKGNGVLCAHKVNVDGTGLWADYPNNDSGVCTRVLREGETGERSGCSWISNKDVDYTPSKTK